MDKIVVLLPKAAEAYRRVVAAGLGKDPELAARARDITRQLVGRR